jgi:FkbM family methyltransferase
MIPSLLHQLLLRRPRLYSRILGLLRRGSIEKRLFLRLIQPGWTVCDVGANRGHFTRLFSELAGPAGAVLAFEPSPATFAVLQSAMADVPTIGNTTLFPLALSDEEGGAALHQPGADDGQASLRTHDAGSWKEPSDVQSFDCKLARLDDLARPWPRLDFIKLDVEGGELPALRGAQRTLARYSPIVFAEVYEAWTAAFGYRPGDLVEFLRANGYTVFYLVGDRVRRYQPGEPISGPANLLAAKSGALPDGLEA